MCAYLEVTEPCPGQFSVVVDYRVAFGKPMGGSSYVDLVCVKSIDEIGRYVN